MRLGHPRIHVPVTTSTMDDVARHAADGAPEGLIVTADHQTAGKGRAGRSWIDTPGAALLVSILLRPKLPPSALSTLPLIIGMAVADTIENLSGVSPSLKWPNDVLIDDRKIAGILVQTRSATSGVDFAVGGIGINIMTQPGSTSTHSVSLHQISTSVLTPGDALEALLLCLNIRYEQFLASGGRPDLGDWTRRAAFLNQWVRVVDSGNERSGRFDGIDPDGALLLNQDGEIRRVVAGDLTRGPAAIDDAALR